MDYWCIITLGTKITFKRKQCFRTSKINASCICWFKTLCWWLNNWFTLWIRLVGQLIMMVLLFGTLPPAWLWIIVFFQVSQYLTEGLLEYLWLVHFNSVKHCKCCTVHWRQLLSVGSILERSKDSIHKSIYNNKRWIYIKINVAVIIYGAKLLQKRSKLQISIVDFNEYVNSCKFWSSLSHDRSANDVSRRKIEHHLSLCMF